MSYNQNIPINTDYMVNSQVQIRSNFQAINSVFTKNHVRFNSTDPGSLQGMHNFLTIREQTIDPTTTTDQVSLYTKNVTSGTNLFYVPSNNQTPIQLTYPSIVTGLASEDPDVYFTEQYSFMAGPFVIYMGNSSAVDNTPIILTPSTTLIYVGLQGKGNAANVECCATNVSGNQFTFRVRNAPIIGVPEFFYLVIGV